MQAGLLGLGFWVSGCLTLDFFLFNPEVADPHADLLARAQGIPVFLKEEIARDVIAEDGTVVNTWLMKHQPYDGTEPSRHRTGIVYCHGNAKNIDYYALRAQALWKMGYTVLIFDYRGYGKTPGTPTEAGLYQDAHAARNYVETRSDLGIPVQRLVLYGYSLGTAVCTQLATDKPPSALILEAPFASIRALVADNTTLHLPPAWFANARMDTQGKIATYPGALLVLHGTHDTFIQARYGQAIHQAAVRAHPNRLWLVPSADHDTAPCARPKQSSTIEGDCAGGFGEAYQQQVTELIDGAVGAAAF